MKQSMRDEPARTIEAMKTTNKILIILAVALAMAAVPNVKADGTLLSPRAQGNQIEIANFVPSPIAVGANATTPAVASIKVTPNPGASLSPRAQGNEIVKMTGTNNDPNLVTLYTYTTVPPRTQAPPSTPLYEIAPVK
jgi:hypothetical protein